MFFKAMKLIEGMAARAQGKGYGATTVKQEVRLLQRLSGARPRLAVDIGGNVGNYTAELRNTNPSLEIHVFEPSAVNIARLSARFGHDSLIRLVPLAVSDTAGSARLFADESGSGLGSLSKRRLDHFRISFDVEEAVTTIRFEDYWGSELQGRPLDLVKLDIEGHELAALRGFGRALNVTRALQFEFGGCNIDTRTYFQDFWYFFRDQHFDLYRITPFGAERIRRYKERDEFFKTTNYIAVRQG